MPGVLWPIAPVLAALAAVRRPAGVATGKGEAGHQSVDMGRVRVVNTCVRSCDAAAWAGVMGRKCADRRDWSAAQCKQQTTEEMFR